MFWTVAALAAGTILSGFLAIGFGVARRARELAALRRAAPSSRPSATRTAHDGARLGRRAGAARPWCGGPTRRPERLAAIKRPLAGGAVVAENMFYWDAAYGGIAYLPGVAALATAPLPRLRALGDLGIRSASSPTSCARSAGPRPPPRPASCGMYATAFVAGRGRARRLLPRARRRCDHRADLPAARRRAARRRSCRCRAALTEGLALLVALAECGLGAVALVGFNVGGGQQYVENRDWISDFGLTTPSATTSAMDGLSLFMVLLTAVGIAAAVGRRDPGRARAPARLLRAAARCSSRRSSCSSPPRTWCCSTSAGRS